MKCMRKWVLSEPLVDPIDHQNILTNSCKFYDINLETVTLKELEFASEFAVKIEVDGMIHGFVSWFDCDFSHGHKKITLSTSPYKKHTHWKQTVFYIDEPVRVGGGEEFTGRVNVAKAKDNQR
jgi:protein arginine N-methyltransferase 1